MKNFQDLHNPRRQRPRIDRQPFYSTGKWVIAAFVVILLGGVLLQACGSYFERETVTTVVTDKERVCESGGGDCKYLVFTEAGTFQVTDAIFGTVRFNSSDVYGRIDEGKTYVITSYGWRLPLLSQYPNIEKMEEVAP